MPDRRGAEVARPATFRVLPYLRLVGCECGLQDRSCQHWCVSGKLIDHHASGVEWGEAKLDGVADVDEPGTGPPCLADRLNLAFEALHPRGSGPYSNAEVVHWIARHPAPHGVPVVESDLAAARAGQHVELHGESLRALASFFEIPPEYFLSNDHAAVAVYEDLRRLVAARTLLSWVRS